MSVPKLNQNSILNDRYVISQLLGKGAFGAVYQAYDKVFDCVVAVKAVSKQAFKQNKKVKELFDSEVTILQKVKNDNIVGFHDYFDTMDTCYLILQYCNEGDLEQFWIQKGKQIHQSEALDIFLQILNGFIGLHEFNVVHRDIKLPNMLIQNGQVKIADLGFAKQLANEKAMIYTILGTSLTMAPEVLEGKSYNINADIYGLGVILFQMLFGNYPFLGRNDNALLQEIKNKKPNFNTDGVYISDGLQDMLTKMLMYDSNKRISWKELHQHPTLMAKKNKKGLEKDLNINNFHQSVYNKSDKEVIAFYEKQEKDQKVYDYQPQVREEDIEFEVYPPVAPPPPPPPREPKKDGMILQENKDKYRRDDDRVEIVEPDNNVHDMIKLRKEMEKENKKIIEKYIRDRNIYAQIMRVIEQMHQIPRTQVNTYIPGYLLLQLLRSEQQTLLSDLKSNINRFKYIYFNELKATKEYKDMVNIVTEDGGIIQAYYTCRLDDVKNIVSQMNNVHPLLLAEIKSDKPEKTFRDILIDSLMNYQFALDEEISRDKDFSNNIYKKKHILGVLDCALLEMVFRGDPNFDIALYNNSINLQQLEEIDQLIEERFALCF